MGGMGKIGAGALAVMILPGLYWQLAQPRTISANQETERHRSLWDALPGGTRQAKIPANMRGLARRGELARAAAACIMRKYDDLPRAYVIEYAQLLVDKNLDGAGADYNERLDETAALFQHGVAGYDGERREKAASMRFSLELKDAPVIDCAVRHLR